MDQPINLSGLTPIGVRKSSDGIRLQWSVAGQTVETDLARFRPVQIFGTRREDLRVLWHDFAELPMTDPFFKGTRDKARLLPNKAAAFETEWRVVSYAAEMPGNIPLSGAIFHMARTGSTLIHRLLSKTERVLSVSELGFVDQALSISADWPEPERSPMLRDALRAFAQRRRPGEQHLVFKMTDGIPNTRLAQFREALPELTWIFVYRDPVEVMVSVLGQPTGNLRQWLRNRARAARTLGMPELADRNIGPIDYLAHTLRRYCANAVEAAKHTPRGRFLAVNYARLPDAVWETVAPHFGIDVSSRERALMQAEARYSSKRRDKVDFTPDSQLKREAASPRVRLMAERLVQPMIDQLKALPQG